MNIPAALTNAALASLVNRIFSGRAAFITRLTHAIGGSKSCGLESAIFDD